MRSIVLAALVAVGLPEGVQAQDEWFARDKAQHFAASAVIAAGAYGAASLVWECRTGRVAFSTAVALSAGVGKELYDRSQGRSVSWKDLVWDALGTTVGVVAAVIVDGSDDCHAPPGGLGATTASWVPGPAAVGVAAHMLDPAGGDRRTGPVRTMFEWPTLDRPTPSRMRHEPELGDPGLVR